MIFDTIKDKGISMALNSLKEKFVNPNIEGIGTVKAISYADKQLHLTLVLVGLEDRDIDITCKDISIAEDGSSVMVGAYTSNMPFAENALNRFASQPFEVPEGAARGALVMAKKALGL